MEEDNEPTSLKKVVLVGPECTGKSTLSSLLAKHYDTVWVPEYARQYIERLERPYEEKDLLKIAQGQLNLEDKFMAQADNVLICDTDLTVIKIWSEHKYGACDEVILQQMAQRKYDLYILTGIDLRWEDDPQRENPHLREYFYAVFKKELEQQNTHYIEVSGESYDRLQKAVEAIDELLSVE
jgi:NadR type nicotinamide-nucleotide adenylyltransferase